MCTDGYRHHDPQLPVTDVDGLAQYQQVLGVFFEAFPDIQIEMHDVFAAAGSVAARWTFSGTHTGALGKMPATGKGVSVMAIIIAHVDHGKLAEAWVVYDCLGMLQQLGAITAPAGG